MRTEVRKGTRRILIVAVLAFCGWWWLQSWVAYRNVVPSVTMTRAALTACPRAELGSSEMSEDSLLLDAWRVGKSDMNGYMTFKHYPVFLCCAVLPAVLGLVPELKEDRKRE